MEWLFAPIDPARAHDVSALVSWHGRAMALAWGGLAPLGVLIARFWKVTPAQDWPNELDNRFWWHSHLTLQWSAVVAFLAGLALILLNEQPSAVGWWHRTAGWSVAALAAAQVMLGLFRGTKGGPPETNEANAPDSVPDSVRGDHFNMTPWRRMFEHAHKSLGYLLLLLAVFGVASGMWGANAPVWMWIGLSGWWAALIAVFIHMQRQGRAIDTYQAIWGPAPDLPGNQIKPIGWGITRRGREPAE